MTQTMKVIQKVIDNITYETPVGTTNCRFCDNNMDDEGTYQDMHAPDCIIHELLAVLRNKA